MEKFLIGAATAAHQVEGNNVNSDFWVMEQMKYTSFKEPSLSAVDHYHRFKEDIDLLAKAGLNAFRFSIEWARIEPKKGQFDKSEIEHYREVLMYCRSKGIEPVVTMHHFSSPKWLIEQGGWEAEETIQAFTEYCVYVVKELGDLLYYVSTINEANTGLQIAALMKSYLLNMQNKAKMGMQVGFDQDAYMKRMAGREIENQEVFGVVKTNDFLSVRTEEGDKVIMRAHVSARDSMKKICPNLKIGVTLSLHDIQPEDNEKAIKIASEAWIEDFSHYVPYLKGDDFFGLQNYTRKLIGAEGELPVPDGAECTQMGYEFYPLALENVIRKVVKEINCPILVTENGIGTSDDTRRIAFIQVAMQGIKNCLEDKIPLLGYLHWSLLDNFEWQVGFNRTFGLIAVDRKTMQRMPKESLLILGSYVNQI